MTDTAIDAVITWVDGSDPAHRSRLEAHLATLPGHRPASADPTRFADSGELAWCLASLLRFAPWLRRIHLVTDRQRPHWWPQVEASAWGERVRIVDHREIFAGFEHCLPTFNSLSISSVLWRIEGLAERFLYINDDFMLLQPLQAEDFFDHSGMHLRGHWRRQSAHGPWSRLRQWLPLRSGSRVRHLQLQENGAQVAGESRRYFRLEHTPYPMFRSQLMSFFAANPELLASNLQHRLRSPGQFNPETLAAHLALRDGRAIMGRHWRNLQIKPDAQWPPRLRAKLRRADRDPCYAFACVQSLERASPALQAELRAWLDRRIGTLADALQDCRPTLPTG